MDNRAQGWRQINGIEMMPVESSTGLIRAFIAFLALIIVGYTILSANCATGGSCTFASGNWFNQIATFLLR